MENCLELHQTVCGTEFIKVDFYANGKNTQD